jgi:hypothetical protein
MSFYRQNQRWSALKVEKVSIFCKEHESFMKQHKAGMEYQKNEAKQIHIFENYI